MKLAKLALRIFRLAPYKIVGVWLVDVLYSVSNALIPFVISIAIDDLETGIIKSFVYLIFLLALTIVIGASFSFIDNRVYDNLDRECKEEYFCKEVDKSTPATVVHARIDRIPEITEFLRLLAINTGGVLFGLGVPLFYLCKNTPDIIFYGAICVTILVSAIDILFAKCMYKNTIIINDESEKEHDIIERKSKAEYCSFLLRIVKQSVNRSDKDAIAQILTNILQLGLLAGSVYYVISLKLLSTGALFASITYILQLNSELSAIPELLSEIWDLKDAAKRLEE